MPTAKGDPGRLTEAAFTLTGGRCMLGKGATVEYRDVPGCPGYRVGDDGTVWCRRGQGGQRGRMVEWRPLKACPNVWGHWYVRLMVGDRRVHRYVHRLVLEAFVGPCPAGMECRHFPDQSPANNRLENLSWATKTANQRDRVANGTRCLGVDCGSAKLGPEQVRRIRNDYKPGVRGYGSRCIAKKYGVSQKTVLSIAKGVTWSHTV